VCGNGLVSFDKGFLQPKPSNEYQSLQDIYIIAPFFASVDMQAQNAGHVSYRVLDLRKNHSAITSLAVKELEQIVTNITSNVPQDFTTSTMLVVTWDKVLPRQRTISATRVYARYMRRLNVFLL